ALSYATRDFCLASILLKKSKIVRRQKSRKCWLLDTDAVDARSSANTAVRGRFSEKGRGPSHRCTRNVSAALENFVRHPQNTFSTVSTPKCDITPPAPRRGAGPPRYVPIERGRLNYRSLQQSETGEGW